MPARKWPGGRKHCSRLGADQASRRRSSWPHARPRHRCVGHRARMPTAFTGNVIVCAQCSCTRWPPGDPRTGTTRAAPPPSVSLAQPRLRADSTTRSCDARGLRATWEAHLVRIAAGIEQPGRLVGCIPIAPCRSRGAAAPTRTRAGGKRTRRYR
jgi:hypothetical protein